MPLPGIIYGGPPVEAGELIRELPAPLQQLLAAQNGFIALDGALHIRGLCREPVWHSLPYYWKDPASPWRRYPRVSASDIPFGQDALGDQFFLRAAQVIRLAGETGHLEPVADSLPAFLALAQANPRKLFSSTLFDQFRRSGGKLLPGQLLNVYPPLCSVEAAQGSSVRPISAAERLDFLAELASQVGDLPPGTKIRLRVTD